MYLLLLFRMFNFWKFILCLNIQMEIWEFFSSASDDSDSPVAHFTLPLSTPSQTEFKRRWDELSFVWIIEMICWAWAWVRLYVPYNEIGWCEYWKGWLWEMGWYETVEVGWQNLIHFTFIFKKQLKNRLVLLRGIRQEISCWIWVLIILESCAIRFVGDN